MIKLLAKISVPLLILSAISLNIYAQNIISSMEKNGNNYYNHIQVTEHDCNENNSNQSEDCPE
jgi:hypothetical protein